MKHKIITILDQNLVEELNKQYKLGYEFLEILSKSLPDARNDIITWRILFRSINK